MTLKRKINTRICMISQLEKNILGVHKLKRFPHEKKLKRLEQLEVISLAFGLERVIINKETLKSTLGRPLSVANTVEKVSLIK